MQSQLPENQQRLVRLMQRLNFGTIENLMVHDGVPVVDPPPRLVREHKFGGGENGPRPEAALGDFALKAEVRELFAELHRIGYGVIDRLEIRHGLPFRLVVTEPLRS